MAYKWLKWFMKDKKKKKECGTPSFEFLEPCPWCGEIPGIIRGQKGLLFIITCSQDSCVVDVEVKAGSERLAIWYWNVRVIETGYLKIALHYPPETPEKGDHCIVQENRDYSPDHWVWDGSLFVEEKLYYEEQPLWVDYKGIELDRVKWWYKI